MKLLKGFTIIEMVVVMAIFLFIIGAALGIFLSIVTNQKRVLSEEQILNQVSYVEEYMSKALRMAKTDEDGSCIPKGYIYLFTRNHDGLYTGIKFLNQSDNDSSGKPACQEFYLDTTTPYVLKEIKTYYPYTPATPLDSDAIPFTSKSLQIKFIKFAINKIDGSMGDGSVHGQGCDGTPNLCGAVSSTSSNMQPQPRVTILLNIQVIGENQTRTIQTTISRRNLNIEQ